VRSEGCLTIIRWPRAGYEVIIVRFNHSLSIMDEVTEKLFRATSGSLDRHNVARTLIARGAKVNASDNAGNRPLHYAAARNHIATVEVLMANGAHVDARNKLGETPLFAAATQGNEGMILRLIDHGADVMATDNAGQLALDQAVARGDEKTAAVLREATEEWEGRLASVSDTELERRRNTLDKLAGLLDAERERRRHKTSRTR
jgi:ankyrin repeat protein